MYHHIRGTLIEKRTSVVVIEAGGVGYLIKIPFSTWERLPAAGAENVTLLTHFNVSENNQTLYGFATLKEREVFEGLTRISGIGPATAIAVLSGAGADQIIAAVVRADVAFLKKIKGIGPKTAQRIILEMRDRLPDDMLADAVAATPSGRMSATGSSVSDNVRDAIEGIAGLYDFQPDRAKQLIDSVAKKLGKDASAADLIRAAIKQLR